MNPNFNCAEFDIIKSQAGLNRFRLSAKEWTEKTNAIGIISKAGRYGGTYAHKDIAFEFAMWISPEFKVYLIREFQRLKDEEQKQLGWTAKRELSKINYRIHTDAIKQDLIPEEVTAAQASIIYAEEADVLNVSGGRGIRGTGNLYHSLYNGTQYEGYTIVPMIDDFKQRFNLGEDFVVVADSGLMNADNLRLLRDAKYKYVIGARIKSEKEGVKEEILSWEKKSGDFYEYKRENGERLIVGYSEARAKKDAYNRSRGVERLRKAYGSGRLTKDQVNKRGYNKFLEISKDVQVFISAEKIAEDEKWDGLKGYVTNTKLAADEVVAQYHGLWVVERAFRVSKGTLEMRPMFHFTERRMEAHVCICFVAYKVYKELERIIASTGIEMSVDKVLDIARTVTTIRVNMPHNHEFYTKTLFLSEQQKAIKPLFDLANFEED